MRNQNDYSIMNEEFNNRRKNSLTSIGDPTEKLFLHTIYSVSKLIDVLCFVLIYTQKGLFHSMETKKIDLI